MTHTAKTVLESLRFVGRQRQSGTKFTCSADDAPEYQQRIVFAADRAYHDGMGPSDFVYATLAGYHDGITDDEDTRPGVIDDAVDNYTNALYAWLLDGGDKWRERALEEDLTEPTNTLPEQLMAGQYLAITAIFYAAWAEAEVIAEELNDDT